MEVAPGHEEEKAYYQQIEQEVVNRAIQQEPGRYLTFEPTKVGK